MASQGTNPSNTTTTTTTSTTTTVSQSRRPRSPSHNNSTSPHNRIPDVVVSQDRLTESGNDNTSEPFPSLPAGPATPSHLAPVRTRDFQDLSPAVTRVSQNGPTTTTTQLRRRPIGIKRLSSMNLRPGTATTATSTGAMLPSGRRRSTSAPQRPMLESGRQDGAPLQHSVTASQDLDPVIEGQESVIRSHPESQGIELREQQAAPEGVSRLNRGSQRLRAVSDAARSAVSRLSNRSEDAPQPHTGEYNDEIIDVLDVLDPEVATLTTLTNVQNSLFVPDLGRWLNRRPTFELTKGPSYGTQRGGRPSPITNRTKQKPLPPTPTPGPVPPKDIELNIPSDIDEETDGSTTKDRRNSLVSITSVVQDEHYAVLPHGVSLEGWSDEDKELLDDHVRHMLHSRRESFKRSMTAFGKYIRNPLGFFVTVYAFLITVFGLVWVLFLIGWISTGAKQSYNINVIDNVLVALFAIVGDGLAPFRAVDTYHMGFIAYYHHLTEKLRKKRNLPELPDHNDLPEKHETEVDVEASIKEDDANFSILTPKQQRRLEHHQEKFSKSHSFYKPHETTTHFAFPHHLFVAIVILLDLHSCFQIALGACTWGINYHTRPTALTPTILSCSITVNILGGVLIKVGDNKTRKKDVLTRMFRQELTEEAMRKVHKERSRDKDGTRETMRESMTEEDMIKEESETGSTSTAERHASQQDLKV